MKNLFTKLFSTNTKEQTTTTQHKVFVWKELQHEQQLELIKENSHNHTQLIFKHSTSCGISGMVLRKFEQQHLERQEEIHFYKLDILANRALSNTVASEFKLRHESPQILVIDKGLLAADNSHYDILQTQLSAL